MPVSTVPAAGTPSRRPAPPTSQKFFRGSPLARDLQGTFQEYPRGVEAMMLTIIESVYRGFRLAAVEQAFGGWQVEITPNAGGGNPYLTMPFRELADAMDEAHRIVDRGIVVLNS